MPMASVTAQHIQIFVHTAPPRVFAAAARPVIARMEGRSLIVAKASNAA